jgi:hypothetical protein
VSKVSDVDEAIDAIHDYIESLEQQVEELQARILANSSESLSTIMSMQAEMEPDMIYKHQCGHCQRFSPLPFLIPDYVFTIYEAKNR